MIKMKKTAAKKNSYPKRANFVQSAKLAGKGNKVLKKGEEKKFLRTDYGEENLFKSIINYFSKQGEKIKSSKRKQFSFFLVGFLVSYLLISFFVGLIPEMAIKDGVGKSVAGILSAQGQSVKEIGVVECNETMILGAEYQSQCYSFFVQDKQIMISWLCTGVLEIIVLISAIIVSFGVCWNKKVVGILFAIVLGIIFNLIRITVTINLILTQDAQTVELAHDLLFRMILFIYIVAVYVIWFYWATKEKNC